MPHYWSEDKDHEGLQQRYRGPKEYGEGTDIHKVLTYTMGRKGVGRGKMNPRYSEEIKYSMATKCQTISESNMDQTAAQPRPDAMNKAIKHRPVPGGKMKTKQQLAFDDPGRSDTGLGNKMGPQPWMAEDSHCRSTDENKAMSGAGTAPGPTPPCPGGAACTVHVLGIIHATWALHLNPKETRVPMLHPPMPRLVGRSWICSPNAVSCPEAVECAVKGRADKQMALWGMAFTAIFFIIACCGYFHIRFCWNKRCHHMCIEPQGSCPGACAADTTPEGHVIRGDVENDTKEKEEGL
ncbi:hypothetical protein Chor_012775 [Crotalus horridus]